MDTVPFCQIIMEGTIQHRLPSARRMDHPGEATPTARPYRTHKLSKLTCANRKKPSGAPPDSKGIVITMNREDIITALAAASNWRKSRHSRANSCIEVASTSGHVGVRDTKPGTSPILAFTITEWAAFAGALKDGQFDL